MAGATIGDVWKVYVKPSMKGRLIVRKKTVNRKSAKVLARNQQLQSLPRDQTPGAIAKKICLSDPNFRKMCVYTAYVYRNGQLVEEERCAWPCFVRLLRQAWRQAGLATARPTAGQGVATRG